MIARWMRAHPWPAMAAIGTGVGLGLCLGLAIAGGLWGIVLMATLVTTILALLVRGVVAPRYRRAVGAAVAVAFALRAGTAAAIYFTSLYSGMDGFVTGDDRNYARIAWAVVEWARGTPRPPDVPPGWGGNDYLLGTFVYIQTGVYWLFGQQVLAAQVLNAGFGAGLLLFIFEICRRVLGYRPALLTMWVVALYPSLILWSALNLKDALALLIVGAIFWALLRFQERPGLVFFALVFLLIVPIESLRRYLYNGMALLAIIATAITPGLPALRRVGWTVTAIAAAALLVSVGTRAGPGVPTGGLAGLEQTRHSMAAGARTSFIDAKTVGAATGDTFLVVDPSRPTQSGAPTPTPRVIIAVPGTRLVLQSSIAPKVNEIVVQPGDIVIFGPPGTTAAPEVTHRELKLENIPAANVAVVESRSGALVLTRTLSYIPTGIANALFAPFPWSIRRTLDALAIPEMLFWYLLLALLPWSFWRLRRQWRTLMPLWLYVGGLLGIFVLAEGNYGTLFRHRAMVIPFVIALNSPLLVLLADRAVERLRSDRGRAGANGSRNVG